MKETILCQDLQQPSAMHTTPLSSTQLPLPVISPPTDGALAPAPGAPLLRTVVADPQPILLTFVWQLLATHRPTQLLIDGTAIESMPKPSDLFEFGKWLPRSLPRAARVALVVRPDQVRHARLIERVARNAGAFLTYFTDRQKAERWVRGPTFPRTYLSSPGSGRLPVTTTATALMKETYVE